MRHLSNADGTVIAYNEYDPFGNPVTAYGVESTFGYTGEQADESGLLFLRARYYDAETGRFLSHDPFAGTLEQPYSQHPYQYGYSNPVRYTDPSGQCVSVGNVLWALSVKPGEMAVYGGIGSFSGEEGQALQAECEGNLAAAGAQWAEGDWGSAGIYATGTAGEVRATAEGFWSTHQALLTTYDPNTTWQERVLPATQVTIFALSWAPAPGAGGIVSQLDDIGRRGRQVFNSVSSCVDDIGRWASGAATSAPLTNRNTVGILVRPRYTNGADDAGHFAVYTDIGGDIQVRGFWPQNEPLAGLSHEELVDTLFNTSG